MEHHRFTSHGLLFVIESEGFDGSHTDFEMICERIEKALANMPAAEITRLHTGAIRRQDGPEAVALDDIGGRIKLEVTRGWHDPNRALVSLIALED